MSTQLSKTLSRFRVLFVEEGAEPAENNHALLYGANFVPYLFADCHIRDEQSKLSREVRLPMGPIHHGSAFFRGFTERAGVVDNNSRFFRNLDTLRRRTDLVSNSTKPGCESVRPVLLLEDPNEQFP